MVKRSLRDRFFSLWQILDKIQGMDDIRTILENVRSGSMSVEDALLQIKEKPFDDIDFAKIDTHRSVRQGTAEGIYGAGKSASQIRSIVGSMRENGRKSILITRLSRESFDRISDIDDITYFSDARIAVAGDMPSEYTTGRIVIVTGGTSDVPVAEEAAVTAQFLGNSVTRIYDVGVAGIHRLFAHLDDIMTASVIIAIAGMEGALASVVGGLADCPVIAVPTSVGYGASFEGLSALLSMLNSCASGVSCVNIDNGFGAAYVASMINKRQDRK